MNQRTIVITTVLLLIMAVSLYRPASGYDYTIHLDNNQFKITWKINAMQNLTAFAKTIAFPQNLSLSLTGADLAALTSPLQSALQARSPTVQLTQPTINLSSNNVNATCSSHCPMQWLNATISFGVQENPIQTNGDGQYDMSWKAIRLEDDLRTNGVPYNTLGETYILKGLASFFPATPIPGRNFLVKVGGLLVNKNSYQIPTQNTVLLDTSGFETPLENWVHIRNLNNQTQTWTSPHYAGFNITATEQITEFDFTTNINFYAAARVSAELSTPLNAFARGNTLFIDLSNGLWEWISAIAIVAVLGILIGTVLLENRLAGQIQRRRKSGKTR
jgi:hypothetical protein